MVCSCISDLWTMCHELLVSRRQLAVAGLFAKYTVLHSIFSALSLYNQSDAHVVVDVPRCPNRCTLRFSNTPCASQCLGLVCQLLSNLD